jgi:hypothetical protein
MSRKHFHVDSKFCVICDDQVEESMTHLFFECEFSRTFWWRIGEECNLDYDLTKIITNARAYHLISFFKEAMI